jgi:two-component system, cell cycle sensor histidine kinase and response regulator CckA
MTKSNNRRASEQPAKGVRVPDPSPRKPVTPISPRLPSPVNSLRRRRVGDTAMAEALRSSEVRYRRLFAAAQYGILILDSTTGLITDVNPYLIELLDCTHEEFVRKTLWEIGLFKDPEAAKAAFASLQASSYVRYADVPLKTKGGRPISVEVVSDAYTEKGETLIQCSIRDITQRQYAEESGRRLLHTQKMEVVGQLTGGLAHDFNNLLGVILNYCEILSDQAELGGSSNKMIAGIHDAVTTGKILTQRLLTFSRRQVWQPVVLDLNATVNHTAVMLGRLTGENVELAFALQSDLGAIEADPGQIEQVLMNLVINARDAMPGGGKVSIGTANVDIDEASARLHSPIEAGRYVMLTVSDTGTGMDLETQSHIFEPFFSTKAPGSGTGLGLSTVFSIVRDSGGTIGVYSEPGHGTSFRIYLPRCDKAPIVIQPGAAMPIQGGNETILLVEDCNPLRHLTQLLLESLGYTILSSGDAVDAIRMAGEHRGPLPLMITDVVMPGVSGPVLAEKVASIRPEIKVLFTSGYSADEFAQSAPDTERAFLTKPFGRDDLAAKVREILDSQ